MSGRMDENCYAVRTIPGFLVREMRLFVQHRLLIFSMSSDTNYRYFPSSVTKIIDILHEVRHGL